MYGGKHARKPKSCSTYCNDNNPRTAIYISKNLTAWFIESLSTRDITVIQTKIKSFNNQQVEFIICVQEPYVYRGKHARKPKSCNTNCNDNNTRAAIYLSKNLTAWFIESLSTRDITVIQTKIKSRETLITVSYTHLTLPTIYSV